ncbi:DUF748 domain-containing protein [Ereboglobus sp. PH5-5]|uniref:DUF748 domain-containing protein n=1 Tax=Ereboglobus sp. PH5-5 TaxID=2940529 RepID=UPI002406FAD7|nr:DUF748 domain-containing protein [Ereboglobus sp. PH5-5]
MAGFFVAPPIAKNILEEQLTKHLSTPRVTRVAQIERVRINPLALSCSVEGLSITASGRDPLVSWDSLQASLDLRTLISREWRLRKIALDGFAGRVAILPDGKPNFADLIPDEKTEPGAPDENKKTAILHINELSITNARIDYSDASLPQPFSTQLGPVNFTARDFQTGRPDRAPGEFSATTESGETLSWRGSLAIAPVSSRGEIRVGNLDIKKYAPFYGHLVRFDVTDGKLDINLRYEVATDADGVAIRTAQSDIALRDLQISERGNPVPAVGIGTISLSEITAEIHTARPAAPVLRIGRIAFDNGAVALRHDARGINLAELFSPAATDSPASATSAPAPAAAPAPAPDITVGEVAVRDFTINIEDATLDAPLLTKAVIDTMSAKNFSLAKLDSPLALELAMRIAGEGELRAGGELALSPMRGKISAELGNLPLTLADAHLGQFLNARIEKGRLAVKADATIDPENGLAVAGSTSVTDLAVKDASGGPLQSWKTLAVREISYAEKPAAKIAITEIALDGSSTQINISPDGLLNIAALAKQNEPPQPAPAPAEKQTPAPASAPAKPAPAASEPPLLITIGKVTLNEGRVAFSDQSIAPAVKMSLDEINGAVSGLSSENLAHADVDVRAKINGAAPVSLTGRVNPLSNDVYTDLRFAIDRAALAPLSPYAGKYAGRTLAGGTLNIDVSTKVSKRFLDSANVITLDQFEFGEHTGSPDATSLPVGLAVSLLRDRNGKIILDVPIKGSLDDPEFKYGRAVRHALANIIMKAATAPFSLLTSVLGIGGKSDGGAELDLSRAEFHAGANTLNEASQKKLTLLAKALGERPALHLAISGGFDADTDSAALRSIRFSADLKQEYLNENSGGQVSAGSTDALQLAPAIEARLVEILYRKKIPAAEQARAETPPTPEAMRAQLLETIRIDDDQLSQLAAARAESVRSFLIGKGVAESRVTLSGKPATGALASLELR